MNIEQVFPLFIAAFALSAVVGVAITVYQEFQLRKQRKQDKPIIQLWKNTEPLVQVSGKKYLEMLSNLS